MICSSMAWQTVDWKALHLLRSGFVDGTAGAQDYWHSERDLESYDQNLKKGGSPV